jgi:hypothetical protein
VLNGLLIALVVVAALACPVMMLLGRRGIGPGCALMGCRPRGRNESLEDVRARQRELARRVAELEADERAPAAARR